MENENKRKEKGEEMRRVSKLPELLAPAGSFEALLAAVSAGADAVYLGGKSYGARAFAQNFDIEEIEKAVRYAHLHGVRVYVTVNVLLFDRELNDCMAYVKQLYTVGVDAIITADLGLIRRMRNELPDMEIHASTQMSVHNTAGAEAACEMGICRVVVARELSLSNITEIVGHSDAEVEVFVHGALCVCHSGQCLFSSLVGGRSGNRGECAQPCRLPYNGKYPLSLQDLSLVKHIRALVDSGVASLKIEGRMKAPSYVYGVTKIYRTLLDEYRDGTPVDERALASLFSRGGRFTDGYFTDKKTGHMTGVRTEEDKEKTRTEERTFSPTPHPVGARASFRLGKPSTFTIFDQNREVSVSGDIPVIAQNSPLNVADLQTRLCKMGATFLSLNKNDIEIELDENINLPPSAINALRRAAAEKFEDTSRPCPPDMRDDATPLPPKNKGEKRTKQKSAMFYRTEILESLPLYSRSAFDIVFVPLFSYREGIPANGVALPPVVFDNEWEEVSERLRALVGRVEYVMIENISHLKMCAGLPFQIVGGMRLNITNRQTRAFYDERGLFDAILSPELTEARIADIGGGVITYGRIPLMITERCFVRENGGCGLCGKFSFLDRKGKRFPALREYSHRNLIFNSVPTYMGDRLGRLRSLSLEHLIFTVENAKECERVISLYQKGAPLACEVRRIK